MTPSPAPGATTANPTSRARRAPPGPPVPDDPPGTGGSRLRRAAYATGAALRTPAGIRFAALIVLVAVLAAATAAAGPDRQVLLRIGTLGGRFAPLVAVGASAVLALVVVPRTLLALVGGALFGWLPGTLYALIGVTIGALVAFGIGRTLGRRFVAERLGGRAAEVERMVARRGALAVAITRLIPIVPFGISNYAFGTSSVRPAGFVLGTMLGGAPAMVAYAALGSATARGNALGMTLAGIAVGVLGVCGSIGTYLVWRRRPRAPRAPAG